MADVEPRRGRPPIVLMIDGHEWSSRSLESILAPNGYAVLRAYNGATGLERARSSAPDLVVLDPTLPDMEGFELCRNLREFLRPSTPIVVSAAVRLTREQRISAFRAGATDVVTPPLDAEELPLRLDALVRMKLEADRAREEGLVDAETGLYNARGLARRADEIGSQSFRRHEALACVVVVPEPEQAAEGGARVGITTLVIAEVLKQAGRISDAFGRLGENEFAVFAPATDATGAVKLAERLAAALCARGLGSANVRFRAGYDAVPDFHDAGVQPIDLLQRARSAARKAAENGSEGTRIRAFDGAKRAV